MDEPYAINVIETDRLILRPLRLEDAEAIYNSYAHDEEVTRFLTWRPNNSVEEVEGYLRKALAAQGRTQLNWVIIRKDNSSLIGMISCRIDNHKVEIGYVLGRAAWGKGFMTEAARAIMDFAFTLPGVYRVYGLCDLENVASARVMEKIGMQREGILRRAVVHPNISDEPRDSLCYAKTL